MALTPGTRLGAYEIVAPIGAGGMGEVYRATDTNLKRAVAIKVLSDALASDDERLARFRREAEVLASLNHPNIAAIYGLERSADRTALVMELVEGPTLADRIVQGPIPFDEALPIAKQIAEALEAAHEQGIIHRDLKPANIKLRPDGVVKVLDFGLAKAMEAVGSSTANATSSPTITSPALMTGVGMLLGTAGYMSPEQAHGRSADRRADIFSFGAVLYELLSGRRAFTGESVSDTLASVLKIEPDWSALPADVPEVIRRLLRRCLTKDRRLRLQAIGEARIVFESPVDMMPGGEGIAVARKTLLWKRVFPVLAGAAVSALLVGGVIWSLRPEPATPSITTFSVMLPEGQRFTNVGRLLLAVSPDGTRIVYIANRRLYLRSMSDTVPKEISGSEEAEGITTPTFSPDGKFVAFVSGRDNALKRISVDGGATSTICAIEGTSLGVNWSDDGILFGVRPGHVFRVSPSGGKPERVFSATDEEAAYGARMLPGGQSMLLTIGGGPSRVETPYFNPEQLTNPHIVWQSLRSDERVTLIERGADARYVPTGHIVYADGGALLAAPFDLKQRQVLGDSVPIVEGVRRSDATLAAQYAVSNNGTLVYVSGSLFERRELAFRDREGRIETLKVASAAYYAPRISPDGKWIAVEVSDGKAFNIFVYDTTSASSIRQLTLQGSNRYPVWSADSTRVAYASDRTGPYAIWWQRADGSGEAEQLMEPENGMEHAPLSFHPSEQTLLFLFRRPGRLGRGMALWTYSLAAKKAQPFAGVESMGSLSAQFSPDGKWVAYHANQRPNAGASVFLRPYPGTTPTVYPISAGTHPVWRPNSSELFFMRQLQGGVFVTRVTTQPSFATSPPVAVPGDASPSFWRNYDISPDGKLLEVTAASEQEAASAQRIEVVVGWFEELKRLAPTE